MTTKTKTIDYTAEDVVVGFGGAVTFSPAAAKATASELAGIGDLGSMTPDDAGRAVQAAIFRATGEDDGHGGSRNGLRVSIDTCIAAVSAIHARKGLAGATVGFTDQPGAASASSGDNAASGASSSGQAGGTAAATGAASIGAGAGAGADPGQ